MNAQTGRVMSSNSFVLFLLSSALFSLTLQPGFSQSGASAGTFISQSDGWKTIGYCF